MKERRPYGFEVKGDAPKRQTPHSKILLGTKQIDKLSFILPTTQTLNILLLN